MNGIEKITGKILDDAKGFEREELENAQMQIADIKDRFSSEAEFIRAKYRSGADREAKDIMSRAEGASVLESRKLLLEAKYSMIERAYEQAADTLRNMPAQQYTDFLVKLLAGALRERINEEKGAQCGDTDTAYDGGYRVLLSSADREKYGDALIAGVKQKYAGEFPSGVISRLILDNACANIDGGLILRCGDVDSNCSVSTLISQWRESSLSDVNNTLFG